MTDKYRPVCNDFRKALINALYSIREMESESPFIDDKIIISKLRVVIDELEEISRKTFYMFDGSPRAMLISICMDIILEEINYAVDFRIKNGPYEMPCETNRVYMVVQKWLEYYEILLDETKKMIAEFDNDKNKNIFNFDDVEKRFRGLKPYK